jgi:hypothetical protein
VDSWLSVNPFSLKNRLRQLLTRMALPAPFFDDGEPAENIGD